MVHAVCQIVGLVEPVGLSLSKIIFDDVLYNSVVFLDMLNVLDLQGIVHLLMNLFVAR